MPEISAGALLLENVSSFAPPGTVSQKAEKSGDFQSLLEQHAVLADTAQNNEEAAAPETTGVDELKSLIKQLLDGTDLPDDFKAILASPEVHDQLKELEQALDGTVDVDQLSQDVNELLAALDSAHEVIGDQPSGLEVLAAMLQDLLQQITGQQKDHLNNTDATKSTMIAGLATANDQASHVQNNASAQQTAAANGDKISQVAEKLQQLWTQIEAKINTAATNKDVAKIAPKVLKLLEEWTSLQKEFRKLGGTEENVKAAAGKATDTAKVWKVLTDAFSKRNVFAAKQFYDGTAKVSASDVSKWMTNAIASQQTANTPDSYSMPMSKLEQYQIHLNPATNANQTNETFTTQFQRIVDTSRFLQSGNLNRQLIINLNPGNLGDVLVKMQRVNGELMVTLLVHSTEAKQLLESNLSQLRHMFSPHQVTVERQEQAVTGTVAPEQQSSAKDQEKEQRQNQGQELKQQEEHKEETAFSEFLMNAKV